MYLSLLEDLIVRIEKSKTTIGLVWRRLAEHVDATIWLSKLTTLVELPLASLMGFPPSQSKAG